MNRGREGRRANAHSHCDERLRLLIRVASDARLPRTQTGMPSCRGPGGPAVDLARRQLAQQHGVCATRALWYALVASDAGSLSSPPRSSSASWSTAACQRLMAPDDLALDFLDLNPPGICEKLACELRPAHTGAKRVDVSRALRRQKKLCHAARAALHALRWAAVVRPAAERIWRWHGRARHAVCRRVACGVARRVRSHPRR